MMLTRCEPNRIYQARGTESHVLAISDPLLMALCMLGLKTLELSLHVFYERCSSFRAPLPTGGF